MGSKLFRWIFIITITTSIYCCSNKKPSLKNANTYIGGSDSSPITGNKFDSLTKNEEGKLPINFIKWNADTLTVDQNAAVVIEPDSLQMDKRMKNVGEDDFRAGMDDYLYYMGLSEDYLEKQNIKTYLVTGKTSIRFNRDDNHSIVLNTDTLSELWNVYLFTPKKDPYKADMISIDEDFPEYFGTEGFDSFNIHFHSDSIFQISRIAFPIKGKYIDGFEQHNWTPKNWIFLKEPVKYIVDTSRFKHLINVSDHYVIEKYWIENSGFKVERHFSLNNGKWYLTYYDDINL